MSEGAAGAAVKNGVCLKDVTATSSEATMAAGVLWSRRAWPPSATGRGRGPQDASYRAAMTQQIVGGMEPTQSAEQSRDHEDSRR